METTEQEKCVGAGWRVGTAEEFLGLSPDEAATIELKLALSDALRAERTEAPVEGGAVS